MHYSSAGEAVKVELLALVLSTTSGLRFVAADLDAATTIVTALAMQLTYAIICRIFAIQNGRDGLAWTIAGFAGGVFATAALLIANEWVGGRTERPGS